MVDREVAVLVQARSGSTRLPGKVLKPVGGVPMLVHVVRRAEQAGYAVTVLPPGDDEAVYSLCHEHGIALPAVGFSGDEADVLGRYAHWFNLVGFAPDTIVRITADCPLLDPRQIRMAVHAIHDGQVDYATNTTRRLPVDGWDVEAFTWEVLAAAHLDAHLPYDREHVTPWIRRHSPRRMHFNVDLGTELQHRWTIDTETDLAWLRDVHRALNNPEPPRPHVEDVLALLNRNDGLRRYSTGAAL